MVGEQQFENVRVLARVQTRRLARRKCAIARGWHRGTPADSTGPRLGPYLSTVGGVGVWL